MMTGALDLTYKYEDKPAGIARDTNISAQEQLEQQEERQPGRRGLTMRFPYRKAGQLSFLEEAVPLPGRGAAGLVLGGLLLLVMGVDPIAYYQRMFTMGMVGNKIAYKTFENYFKVFVPLVLTSVALSLAFKMRFWNIGGRGTVYPGRGGRRRRGP